MSEPETVAIQKVDAVQALESKPSADAAATLLGIIGAAVQNPEIDPGKVERLLAVYQTVLEDKRKTAFYAALARLQAKLPQIRKTGRIVDSKGGMRRYAKLEDIGTAIRPLLQEEGFAFSFNEQAVGAGGKFFEISATLSHREGHSEMKKITVPFDDSSYRTPIQSRGSTQAYAHRYLIKMHLDIIERGEDDDGTGVGIKAINREQMAELRRRLTEINLGETNFLKYMGRDRIEAILVSDLPKAINLIEGKQRYKKEAERK